MRLPRRQGGYAGWTWQDLAARVMPTARMLREERVTESSNATLWLAALVFFGGRGWMYVR